VSPAEAKRNKSLLELVSSKVGVIRSLSPVVRGAEEPNPPILYQATLSHFDFRKAQAWERGAAGKGLKESEAILSAIGEAVEHYCASHFDAHRTKRAPWSSVAPEAVRPHEFVLYSASQYARAEFPYRQWDPMDEVTWLLMDELPAKRQIFAPAAFVFLASGEGHREDSFCPATSNGLAAGPNLQFAILHGLYELVERDGFLITWMNQLPVPQIEFSKELTFAHSIREHYSRFGVEIHVFNVSTDLPIYVMMGLALDRSGRGPAAVVGLGCHLDPSMAMTKALFEVCQVRPSEVQRFQREHPAEKLASYQDVHTLEDHSAFFHPIERLKEFSFLLDSDRKQHLRELSNRSQHDLHADLETCVTALTAAGSRVLFADLTTSDIAPYGLRVVRTVATGLQPMHFGYGEERLGGRRLYETPKVLGYSSGVRAESDLNPCPHPLA
jgi:ribosomal protein S12 methylthiotransferase accessory factor